MKCIHMMLHTFELCQTNCLPVYPCWPERKNATHKIPNYYENSVCNLFPLRVGRWYKVRTEMNRGEKWETVGLPYESAEAKHKCKSTRISMKWLPFYCNRLKIDMQICNNKKDNRKYKHGLHWNVRLRQENVYFVYVLGLLKVHWTVLHPSEIGWYQTIFIWLHNSGQASGRCLVPFRLYYSMHESRLPYPKRKLLRTNRYWWTWIKSQQKQCIHK